MTATPRVSIVILTYNNPAILRRCIQSACDLDHPAYEVLVVDNASTDDTAKIVAEEFPQVRLITCDVNGPTAARNKGFWAAQGDIVLSLDHDMVIPDATMLSRAEQLMDAFPSVAVLSPKICDQEHPDRAHQSHWWYPTSIQAQDEHFLTSYFAEGAVFFRADALRAAGGYDERFFHVAENLDLAFKLQRLDWQILYCPDLATVELVVSGPLAHRRSKSNEYVMRNRLWLAWKHYPVMAAVRFAAPRIVKSAALAVRYRWFDYYFAGLVRGLFPPAAIRAERQALPPEKWAEIAQVEGTRVTPPKAAS